MITGFASLQENAYKEIWGDVSFGAWDIAFYNADNQIHETLSNEAYKYTYESIWTPILNDVRISVANNIEQQFNEHKP